MCKEFPFLLCKASFTTGTQESISWSLVWQQASCCNNIHWSLLVIKFYICRYSSRVHQMSLWLHVYTYIIFLLISCLAFQLLVLTKVFFDSDEAPSVCNVSHIQGGSEAEVENLRDERNLFDLCSCSVPLAASNFSHESIK